MAKRKPRRREAKYKRRFLALSVYIGAKVLPVNQKGLTSITDFITNLTDSAHSVILVITSVRLVRCARKKLPKFAVVK